MLIGWPMFSDESVLHTPTFDGGMWSDQLPLANLINPELAYLARSWDVNPRSTRLREDLKVDRQVGIVGIPKHSISSAGKVRYLGVPSTMLFDYEAGDDIAANGGTFSRAPNTSPRVRAATYIDRLGVVQLAGENRLVYSEDFDNAAWTKTTTTVAANSVANPHDGTVDADTLTATGGNSTTKGAQTTTAISYTFSVWLKRLTGTGDIDVTMDGTTWVTVAVTTAWQRFEVTQTAVGGTSNPGIRIVTSGDAVYAWGGQMEIGSSATAYLGPTAASAISAPRDGHYTSIGGECSILLEGARTNLCLQSEDFQTTWIAVGSPTQGTEHTAAGLTLDLIGDDDGAALEYYYQDISFTASAVRSVSIFMKAGTAVDCVVRLGDQDAAVNRLLAKISWSGGVPTVAMTTGVDLWAAGTSQLLKDGVYHFKFQTTSIVHTNRNRLYVYPATDEALDVTDTGTVYAGGVQAEDSLAPSSYIPTTTATVARAKDVFSFPWAGGVPAASSFYADYDDQGGSSLLAAAYICWLGATDATDPHFALRNDSSAGREQAVHDNNTDAAVTSIDTSTTTFGQRVEVQGDLASDGAVQLTTARDGGSSTAHTASSAPAAGLAAAWAGSVMTIGADGAGNNQAPIALRSLRVGPAGVQTFAVMQAIVYDSGWLTPWPTGETAEDLDGLNVGHFDVVPSTQTAFRYASVQIDDTANADGYVDLHRFVVAGAYEPTLNMSYGAKFRQESATTKVPTDGGAEHFNVKKVRRGLRCVLGNVAEAEAFANPWKFQRQLGLDGQVVIMPDQADTTLMHERAFLARLETLGELEAVYLSRFGFPLSFREVL